MIIFLPAFVKPTLRKNHEFYVNFLGGVTIYELFKAEIVKQKRIRKLTNKDLGKLTGYKRKTIDAFMAGAGESENVAKAIAKVLNIEL